LIHPSGATASTWGDLVDRLAAFGQVIVYDRRGYGRSPGEPLPSIGAHTADLATLLDNLGVTDAVISGTSIGATIAIDLARLRPDLVRAVVAHESPWHVTRQPPTFAQMAALSKMTWLSSRGRPADAVAAFLRFAYHYRDGGSAWDRFPDAWRQAAADNAEASLADIRIAIGGYPATKDLSTVSRPVVCTCGSRSAPTMTRVTRKLARVLPAGVFHQIEGAGHAAPFDAPAAFSELIAESVTRV
jgi:pimeloyl-ACP methyl ester carboxylesterase